jgi:hypothetical protein
MRSQTGQCPDRLGPRGGQSKGRGKGHPAPLTVLHMFAVKHSQDQHRTAGSNLSDLYSLLPSQSPPRSCCPRSSFFMDICLPSWMTGGELTASWLCMEWQEGAWVQGY